MAGGGIDDACTLAVLSKGLLPTGVSELLQFLVANISGHDGIHYQTSEAMELRLRGKQERPQVFVPSGRVIHEQIPTEGQGILFGDRSITILLRKDWGFFHQARIGYSGMIYVVDERRKNASELGQRVRGLQKME